MEHYRQQSTGYRRVRDKGIITGAIEQLMSTGKSHCIRRPAVSGDIDEGLSVVNDNQFSRTLHRNCDRVLMRDRFTVHLSSAVFLDEHSHGDGSGVRHRDSQTHAAADAFHNLFSCCDSQLHGIPSPLGGDREATSAREVGQPTAGDSHIGNRSRDGDIGIRPAPNFSQGSGGDGNLSLCDISADNRRNKPILTVACNSPLDDFCRSRSPCRR